MARRVPSGSSLEASSRILSVSGNGRARGKAESGFSIDDQACAQGLIDSWCACDITTIGTDPECAAGVQRMKRAWTRCG